MSITEFNEIKEYITSFSEKYSDNFVIYNEMRNLGTSI